ncbi:GSCOCG00009887001-RA-CDS [Cotesia congregata]|nr:GSCOCG00009887001-RA-CDS [Cotesia congregata]
MNNVKMSLDTKQRTIMFTFTAEMDTYSGNSRSLSFKTADIPDTEFNISTEKTADRNYKVQIKKSDLRPAVAIIKLKVDKQKPLIHPVVDWTQNVDFNHILICVTPDWQKDISYKCEFSYSRLYRSIPVHCSITWQGYIEDTYYLDMCTHIKNYYKNTEFSNMKIKVGDCEFPAHKNLLAKHSPVFHKILISDMKESIENIISFPDADVSTVKEMLLFFYEKKLDEATKNEEMTLKLLKFAAMYEISRLKTACEYILIKSLRIDNIFILYAVGKYYNSTILQQHALIFLKNNASDLLEGACEMFE